MKAIAADDRMKMQEYAKIYPEIVKNVVAQAKNALRKRKQ